MHVCQSISWQHVLASLVVYLGSLAFYRLFLDPLAKFPGPKLAALTRWYEGYYDVIRNGQYTFKIAELHKTYGMFCVNGMGVVDTDTLGAYPLPKVPSSASVPTSFT